MAMHGSNFHPAALHPAPVPSVGQGRDGGARLPLGLRSTLKGFLLQEEESSVLSRDLGKEEVCLAATCHEDQQDGLCQWDFGAGHH